MKVVIAPDSFKGSLSAKKVADAIESGLLRVNPCIETIKIPMADGGEGIVESLIEGSGGRVLSVGVHDPLMRPIEAVYGIMGDGVTAVIEMAKASGLPLLSAKERNPMLTTTYGTGELILDALNQGCTRMIIGLGGSATNDGGQGMLCALGVQFLNEEGQPIALGGGALGTLARIDVSCLDKRIATCDIVVACDVSNPLIGVTGATHVFSRQKGADDEMILALERNMTLYGERIYQTLGISVNELPGAGAAGGMGAAVTAFLGGALKRGIDIVIEASGLESAIRSADLVITGEGSMDHQTLYGKVPSGVAKLAQQYGKPVIGIAGGLGDGAEQLYGHGFKALFSIVDRPMSLEEAMAHAEELLSRAAERMMRTIMIEL
ncbi:MAG: glycerate kinase [Clostridia bacterium]|nr:glycerate kinase [Clostridia bacterium]